MALAKPYSFSPTRARHNSRGSLGDEFCACRNCNVNWINLSHETVIGLAAASSCSSTVSPPISSLIGNRRPMEQQPQDINAPLTAALIQFDTGFYSIIQSNRWNVSRFFLKILWKGCHPPRRAAKTTHNWIINWRHKNSIWLSPGVNGCNSFCPVILRRGSTLCPLIFIDLFSFCPIHISGIRRFQTSFSPVHTMAYTFAVVINP